MPITSESVTFIIGLLVICAGIFKFLRTVEKEIDQRIDKLDLECHALEIENDDLKNKMSEGKQRIDEIEGWLTKYSTYIPRKR